MLNITIYIYIIIIFLYLIFNKSNKNKLKSDKLFLNLAFIVMFIFLCIRKPYSDLNAYIDRFYLFKGKFDIFNTVNKLTNLDFKVNE